jgi:hypothetical protein
MKKIIALFSSLFLLTTSVFAANIYVNHTGSNTAPYDTEVKAARVIQVALDAAGSGDTILIKADANYVMNGTDQPAATIDIDHNPCRIRGYYLTVGDQEAGGAYYKDGTHGWVVIDGNSGAYSIFTTGALDDIRVRNIKFINVNSGKFAINALNSTQSNYVFQNLWLTGVGEGITMDSKATLIEDCKFTGSYLGDVIGHDGGNYPGTLIVRNCYFEVTSAASCVFMSAQFAGWTLIVENNIFNILGTISNGVIEPSADYYDYLCSFSNNTVYMHPGATGTGFVNAASGINYFFNNNIIANSAYGITSENGRADGGYNCLYNNSAGWTLRTGDITTDPLFVDAPNGDFRLKPASPCINTGKPTYNGGKTTMGAWQPGLSDVFGGI